MLNKILSKKIKFPLSLRGAKRRSNLNGFSLIELMVAVAILIMAIFGIFHAYSVGFMGMADARDITVATNYAREAMEDIKNMDFDQIITQSRNYIDGTKYEREVIVQPSTNLKEVTTKVYWKDRNGNTKIVETDMVVHFIVTTAGAATKILLYADPYNILTGGSSEITAVIKDDKGNTVKDNGSISFSATNGTILNPAGPTDGKATATFNAPSEVGVEGVEEITITASGTSEEGVTLTSDSVIIIVTNPERAVKINLVADPPKMKSGGEQSTITATIVNAVGGPVAISKEITFSVSGPGNLSLPTTVSTVDGDGNPTGIATVTLTSNSPPGGTITVTASATDLEPGVIDVITGGQITLSASPIEVPKGEQSVITVTTKDAYGIPINYIGDIELSLESLDSGSGYFVPSELSIIEINFDGNSFSKTITFYAASEGTVNINAYDKALILEEGEIVTLPLTIKLALDPDHIEVYAIPSSIPAGGTETSLITAKVMTVDNIKITSYNEIITFTTTAGLFPNESTTITTEDLSVTYIDGVATVELYPTLDPGTATIMVSSDSLFPGSTQVGFYIEPNRILLSAVPQNISVGGQSCIVTAKIIDNYGTLINDYNEDITFIISPWYTTIKFAKASTYILTQKVKKGIATVILTSGSVPGTAVIDAYSGDISGSLNIPVGISLILADNINHAYDSDNNISTVSFDIEVLGADLLLEEMQVSWELPSGENLNRIEVNGTPIFYIGDEPVDPIGSITYPEEDPTKRIADVNVIDITLPMVTSSVTMDFDINMFEKNMDVIFNPNSGNYSVNFIVP